VIVAGIKLSSYFLVNSIISVLLIDIKVFPVCFTHHEEPRRQQRVNKPRLLRKQHRVNTKTAIRVGMRQTVVQLNFWIFPHPEKICLPVDAAVNPGGVMLLSGMKPGKGAVNNSGVEI
jgi:hypothetical protein